MKKIEVKVDSFSSLSPFLFFALFPQKCKNRKDYSLDSGDLQGWRKMSETKTAWRGMKKERREGKKGKLFLSLTSTSLSYASKSSLIWLRLPPHMTEIGLDKGAILFCTVGRVKTSLASLFFLCLTSGHCAKGCLQPLLLLNSRNTNPIMEIHCQYAFHIHTGGRRRDRVG